MKTKTMKKMMAIVMCTLLMLCLAVCGNKQQAAGGGAAKPSPEAEDRNEAESETSEESAGTPSVEEAENESNADGTVSDAANTENMESESGKLLEEMAGTGNWLEGERFSSGVSEEDVKTWVDSLGL